MSLRERLKKSNTRVLTIDIENSPNLAHVWGLFKQNISLGQLQDTSKVMCFAAKWYDEKDTMFYSDHKDGHEGMIEKASDLLNEADMVVGYNSKGFDMKHLNREILLAGLPQPTPYKNIDLLTVVRQNFRFTSNKLDHVAQELGLGGKTSHSGFQLWLDCMAGDPKAWKLMEKYNRQDVKLTEALYDRLRGWIPNHPHLGLYTGQSHVCPNCGGSELIPAGTNRAQVQAYYQYRCKECGHVSRSTFRDDIGKITTRHAR